MRLWLGVTFVALFGGVASAAEVQVKLDDGAQQAVAQLPAAIDQCVASLTLRGDPAVCRSVSQFAVLLGNEVKAAQTRAEQEATDRAKAAEKAKK